MNNVKRKIQNYEFSAIVARIKEVKAITDDHNVASLLGFSRTAFSERKRRNSIPHDKIQLFCERESINMDWLLTGKGPMIREQTREPHQPIEKKPDYDPNLGRYDLEDLYSKLSYSYNNGTEEDRDRLYGAISRIYNKVLHSGGTEAAGDNYLRRLSEEEDNRKKSA